MRASAAWRMLWVSALVLTFAPTPSWVTWINVGVGWTAWLISGIVRDHEAAKRMRDEERG